MFLQPEHKLLLHAFEMARTMTEEGSHDLGHLGSHHQHAHHIVSGGDSSTGGVLQSNPAV